LKKVKGKREKGFAPLTFKNLLNLPYDFGNCGKSTLIKIVLRELFEASAFFYFDTRLNFDE
jgi:hypothetical protein